MTRWARGYRARETRRILRSYGPDPVWGYLYGVLIVVALLLGLRVADWLGLIEVPR